jgi:hypothetical protein
VSERRPDGDRGARRPRGACLAAWQGFSPAHARWRPGLSEPVSLPMSPGLSEVLGLPDTVGPSAPVDRCRMSTLPRVFDMSERVDLPDALRRQWAAGQPQVPGVLEAAGLSKAVGPISSGRSACGVRCLHGDQLPWVRGSTSGGRPVSGVRRV